ncbi:MAG: hypothetical protein IAE87_01875 [Rhodobacteraceae bacterium]|jgi:hypothetical protein|nr:hypothetical protein [Paracoccaceae bacterium]
MTLSRSPRTPQPRYSSPRKFAAGITAAAAVAALVLSTALPARAGPDRDDIAKGLLAVLVIGALAHEAKKAGKPAPAPEPEPAGIGDRDDSFRHGHDRRERIPRVCAIEIEGNHRSVELYAESCLRDEGVRGALPRDCASRALIFGQRDRVYGVDCLRDAGFRVDRDW